MPGPSPFPSPSPPPTLPPLPPWCTLPLPCSSNSSPSTSGNFKRLKATPLSSPASSRAPHLSSPSTTSPAGSSTPAPLASPSATIFNFVSSPTVLQSLNFPSAPPHTYHDSTVSSACSSYSSTETTDRSNHGDDDDHHDAGGSPSFEWELEAINARASENTHFQSATPSMPLHHNALTSVARPTPFSSSRLSLLSKASWLIGRHSSCDIPIGDDCSLSLSRYHARLLHHGEERSLYIQDLGSVHGTFVDGRRIEATSHTPVDRDATSNLNAEQELPAVRLQHGSVISFGACTTAFRVIRCNANRGCRGRMDREGVEERKRVQGRMSGQNAANNKATMSRNGTHHHHHESLSGPSAPVHPSPRHPPAPPLRRSNSDGTLSSPALMALTCSSSAIPSISISTASGPSPSSSPEAINFTIGTSSATTQRRRTITIASASTQSTASSILCIASLNPDASTTSISSLSRSSSPPLFVSNLASRRRALNIQRKLRCVTFSPSTKMMDGCSRTRQKRGGKRSPPAAKRNDNDNDNGNDNDMDSDSTPSNSSESSDVDVDAGDRRPKRQGMTADEICLRRRLHAEAMANVPILRLPDFPFLRKTTRASSAPPAPSTQFNGHGYGLGNGNGNGNGTTSNSTLLDPTATATYTSADAQSTSDNNLSPRPPRSQPQLTHQPHKHSNTEETKNCPAVAHSNNATSPMRTRSPSPFPHATTHQQQQQHSSALSTPRAASHTSLASFPLAPPTSTSTSTSANSSVAPFPVHTPSSRADPCSATATATPHVTCTLAAATVSGTPQAGPPQPLPSTTWQESRVNNDNHSHSQNQSPIPIRGSGAGWCRASNNTHTPMPMDDDDDDSDAADDMESDEGVTDFCNEFQDADQEVSVAENRASCGDSYVLTRALSSPSRLRCN